MKNLTFHDVYGLSCFMIESLDDVREHGNVTAVLQYDTAQKLLSALLAQWDVEPECIDLAPQYVYGYTGEYYVTLDDTMKVWIEPAIRKGVVLWHDSDLILYEEGTDSRIIARNEDWNAKRYTVAFQTPCEDALPNQCEDCAGDCTDCHSVRIAYY